MILNLQPALVDLLESTQEWLGNVLLDFRLILNSRGLCLPLQLRDLILYLLLLGGILRVGVLPLRIDRPVILSFLL